MPYISRRRVALGTILSLSVGMIGCTGQDTLSSYARNGDTVVVAFGAINFTADVQREDLTALLTDSGGAVKTVKVRLVTNVYPDPVSHLAADRGDWFHTDTTGIRSAVIDLVNPANNSPLSPTPAPGAATLALKVGSTTLAAGIRVQILPGTGTPHPFLDTQTGQNYTEALNARPHIRFRVKPNSTVYPTLSAVEVEIKYLQSTLLNAPAETSYPQAVPTAADTNLQFSTRYYQDGAYEVIKVVMVNPDGITNSSAVPFASFYRGMSWYDSLKFSVVWGNGTILQSYPPESWFDASVISGATKTLKVFDTTGSDVTSYFTLAQE